MSPRWAPDPNIRRGRSVVFDLHVHLVLRKEFTARIDRAFMHGHLWSPSYFAASCDGAPLAIIREYIENRKRPDQRPQRGSGTRGRRFRTETGGAWLTGPGTRRR
ncbi:transposase [Microtetraspora fusca]|uniref:transposase n=1 Tax=Microtetraspora fusca TaxID=1997 RepID=UPI003571056F